MFVKLFRMLINNKYSAEKPLSVLWEWCWRADRAKTRTGEAVDHILLFTTVGVRSEDGRSLTGQHSHWDCHHTQTDQQSGAAQDKGRPCCYTGQAWYPPCSHCVGAGRRTELVLCIVCVSSFPRWRLQSIQYGRWNDIKFSSLSVTFSNKEEQRVHVSLELKSSVIGWALWVKSSSLLENKNWNNDQLFAVVREQLIQCSAGSPSCCLAHYDGVTQQPPALPGDLTGCPTYLAGLTWLGSDI